MRDALAVFQEAIGNLTNPATTHGGEWAGRCPLPGCTSRENGFRCWPNRPRSDGPAYWCRRCDRHGDLIQFVRDCYGYSYAEARDFLEIGYADEDLFTGSYSQPKPTAEKLSLLWQSRAYEFASAAYQRLWSDKGKGALRYLTEERGLSESLLRAYRWGCIGETVYEDGTKWGFEPGTKVYIPRGIVIPLVDDNVVWGITIRRPDIDVELLADGIEDPYWMIKGSKRVLYGAQTIKDNQPVVMVESYIDRLTLLDVMEYPVVATGSTTGCRDESSLEKLARASIILQAFDNDEPGNEAAEWWREKLPDVVQRLKPSAKDVNAMDKEALTLWAREAEFKVDFVTVPSTGDLFASAEPETEKKQAIITPSVASPDDRRAFFLAEYACCICHNQNLSNSFLHAKSGRYCAWCYEQAPEYMHVQWHRVKGVADIQGRHATFMLAWLVFLEVRKVTCCFYCEEEATHYDTAGRLWCATHAPTGAARHGELPHHLLDDLSSEIESQYDFERCFLCGQDEVVVDDHLRCYCPLHMVPTAAEVDGLYPKLLAWAEELRVSYIVAPELLLGPGCERCKRQHMYEGQGKTFWCEVHKSGYELLEDGLKLGYPELTYPGGTYLTEVATGGHVAAGRQAWMRFSREAADVEVWAAKVHTWNILCGRENKELQKEVRPPAHPCTRHATVGCRGSTVARWATIDRFGNSWCPDCHCAGELLDEGDDAGFPPLGPYGGYDIYKKGGYKAYDYFVRHEPSPVALETARNFLRQQVGNKTP